MLNLIRNILIPHSARIISLLGILNDKHSLTPGVAVWRLNTEEQRLKDWWKDFADTPERTKHSLNTTELSGSRTLLGYYAS